RSSGGGVRRPAQLGDVCPPLAGGARRDPSHRAPEEETTMNMRIDFTRKGRLHVLARGAWVIPIAALALSACSPSTRGAGSGGDGDRAEVSLQILQAPADATCIRITASGPR